MSKITFIPVNSVFVACVDGLALVHTGAASTVLGTPKWYTTGDERARGKVQKALDSGRGSLLPLGDPRAAAVAVAANPTHPAPVVAPEAAKAAGDRFRAAVAAHRAAAKAPAAAPATPAAPVAAPTTAAPTSRIAALEAEIARLREEEAAEQAAAEAAAKAALARPAAAPSATEAAIAALAALSAADFTAALMEAARRRAG